MAFESLLLNFWNLINQVALFLIIGVVLAGILKYYIKKEFISRHLDGSFSSIFKATLLGIPLPLCSCSVIPFISSLKDSGAKNSSLLSFAVSTPITGIDSIMVTYGVFGWFFTIYRLFTAVFISLVLGMIAIIFNKKSTKNTSAKSQIINLKFNKKEIFYSIVDIARDIAKPLLLGLILAAFITTYLPSNMSDFISGNLWFNYILVIFMSLPLYVCATASIPLGLALLSSGFSYGAMFIFLSAGPASNIMTIMVIKKLLGIKNLILYLSTVICMSLIFGFLLDYYFTEFMDTFSLMADEHIHFSIINTISSVVLLVSIIALLIPKQNTNKKKSCC
ncbi:MAG: Transporter [uncultured Campylobacterales bacterium]|uniref:Transporter n=1 Tax=uncultured Campylobacterales bacterium TaxID=352960 RepID=A0A6S6T7G3_9BACT|nr:MAG: Transporter [uncultured Campylobacterales bacterium]